MFATLSLAVAAVSDLSLVNFSTSLWIMFHHSTHHPTSGVAENLRVKRALQEFSSSESTAGA